MRKNRGRVAFSMRVLVIDDDEDIRRLLCDIVTAAGHLVRDAAGGSDAIEIFKQETFDLVLTDLQMPGMSGWEVARAIKMLNPNITIAMITGGGENLNETQLKICGISAIVNKPFKIDQIVRLAAEVQSNICADRSDAGKEAF